MTATAQASANAQALAPLRTLLFSLEKEWSVAQEQALALATALHGCGRYDVRLCCPPDSALAQRARQQQGLAVLPVSSPRHLPSLFRLWRGQQRKQPLLMHSFDVAALQLAERLTHVRRPGSTVLLHSCLVSPVDMEAGTAYAHEGHALSATIATSPDSPDSVDGAHEDGKKGPEGGDFATKGPAHKGWQLADKILCAGGKVRSLLARSGVDAARLQVIHPSLHAAGLPLRRARGDGRFVFVAAEELHQGAGLFVLLRAMAALWQRTDLPPWEVRVVGAGHALTDILDEARSLGVEARLALLSRQSWGEVLPRCDALLVPNRQPCGNMLALMAAWCCALPLICTDTASHGEVLRAAGQGVAAKEIRNAALSVPPGEAQALAAAMIRLLTEPELCAQLALQGAAMHAYADHARMVEQALRQYEDCLSRKGWVLPPMHAPVPADSAPVVAAVAASAIDVDAPADPDAGADSASPAHETLSPPDSSKPNAE